VVVARPGPGAQPELLVLRRSDDSPFMPGMIVFPGGRVDPGDGPAGSDESFRAAARRECQEEAGLDLADATLRWFDTWLTPSAEPRRYLARFFLAELAAGRAAVPRVDGIETVEARWGTAAELLDRWREGEADLPPPTLATLLRLSRPGWRERLVRDPDLLREPIVPKLAPHGTGLRILMPHHPDYAHAPGEGGPAPARVSELPTGFSREAGRWTVALALGLSVLACGRGEPPVEATPAAAPAAEESNPTPSTRGTGARGLLGWLEPQATGIAYLRLPPDVGALDPEPLATAFALPPRARELLVSGLGLDAALAAVLGPEGPAPSDLLGRDTLVMVPAVATGSYLVRPLARPAAEVESALTAQGLQRAPVDGATVLVSRGAFPYKVALLGDPFPVAAFVPAGEIGTGIGPLTAARDLPASPAREELASLLESDPAVVLVALSAGPMLHLDLTDDVALARLVLRRWQGGLDAEVRLQTTGDPELAARELEGRTLTGESDQLRALADRVAFAVDGPTVAGRLQLTRDDLVHFTRSR
jgi:8-oxo-dGTP pyrophosphatase MutT (NUDIX family)